MIFFLAVIIYRLWHYGFPLSSYRLSRYGFPFVCPPLQICQYPENTPLLVQYCPNNVSRLRHVVFDRKFVFILYLLCPREFAQWANTRDFVGPFMTNARQKPEYSFKALNRFGLFFTPRCRNWPNSNINVSLMWALVGVIFPV